ncbi:hypothetical protein ACHQM5_001745 [Ranunculus cassubicifolius]
MKHKHISSEKKVSIKWIFIFCISSFALGVLFTTRIWDPPMFEKQIVSQQHQEQELKLISDEDCAKKQASMLKRNGWAVGFLCFVTTLPRDTLAAQDAISK